jgi:4-hydroxybenzoate polyprenyltransferase
MSILKLIRFKNLLIIAFVQIVLKYVLFDAFEAFTTLNPLQFGLLTFSTICIAAAGYIFNDIQDVATDSINKPHKVLIGKTISKDLAYNLYMILTLLGVGLGMYVANSIDKNSFFSLFVLSAGLLYVYSNTLKPIAVVGNLTVSFLVVLSLLIIGIFDLMPAITEQNKAFQKTMFSVLLDYSIFAFFINFIREMVKDIEDINGDHSQNMKTLPIILGQARTAKICFGLCLLAITGITYYVSTYFYKDTFVILYMLILVVAPLIYCAIKLFSAKQKKEFTQVSLILKLTMLTGICSMFLFKYILN